MVNLQSKVRACFLLKKFTCRSQIIQSIPVAHQAPQTAVAPRTVISKCGNLYSAKCVKPAPQNHANPKWVDNSNNAIKRDEIA